MFQPRSTVSTVPSSRVHDYDGMLSHGDTAELPPGQGVGTAAKKRRREGAGAPKKRHRREQRGLCELNFDELYIIFAYIYPMDLLNLSRTCKSLRAILTHKSSLFLWRTALRQIEGLPPCPPDLTAPEYTNLVFHARCHGCDKPAKTIFWHMRRRYCPACRVERLYRFIHCDDIIRENRVLPSDWFTVGDDPAQWVDRDKADSFMREYHSSSDKAEFLNEKRKLYRVIDLHAHECQVWQQQKGRVHRFDLEVLRKERQASIFERLQQRGYGPEIAYFQNERIEKSYKSIFKKHKPLTDSEWDQIWPKWVEIMDEFRSQRLEATLYQPRRRSFVSEYDRYVKTASPDSPILEVLPHVVDLSRFPLFRNIINAPEGTQLDENTFASAFAQLPTLVGEWTRKLDSEVAGLVKIPSSLSSNIASWDQDIATSSTRRAGSAQTDLDKLHLACAVFHVGGTGAFAYPEVLSVSVDDSERTGSIYDRFGLQFLDEAPYIIYACGLDPNMATVDDMDKRNARLRCLCCGGRTLIMNWRHAIWHARFYHCIGFGLAPLAMAPRWQLVNDGYIDAIQAVERSVQKAFSPDWTRCLLCRPCVGDAMLHDNALRHLVQCHGVERSTIKEGTHYKLVGIRDVCVVEMVQIGGFAMFRVLRE